MIPKMIDMDRAVVSLESAARDEGMDTYWLVGQYGVVSITPYEENGEMAAVLWFQVLMEDGSESRVSASSLGKVAYGPTKAAEVEG